MKNLIVRSVFRTKNKGYFQTSNFAAFGSTVDVKDYFAAFGMTLRDQIIGSKIRYFLNIGFEIVKIG